MSKRRKRKPPVGGMLGAVERYTSLEQEFDAAIRAGEAATAAGDQAAMDAAAAWMQRIGHRLRAAETLARKRGVHA